jgi:hypothetical protein
MSLDCLTEKGQEAIAHSRIGAQKVPRVFIETAQDKAGDIDGFFLDKDEKTIAAAVEIKARDMTEEELRTYKSEWLVTFEKIQKGAHIAKSLCVPFYGLLYLIPDQKTYLIKLADDHGNIVAPMRLKVTETQANCNGGHAERTNAYICMKEAKVYG